MTDCNTQDKILRDVMNTCLNLKEPKSFFLFAGAGSGKTRALVEAMQMIRENNGMDFRHSGRKVAVITYTNAACDEIKRRTDYDSIFTISTIHSFVWELIQSYHRDIREWLKVRLQKDINELNERQRERGKKKTAADRTAQIDQKQKRLDSLDKIKKFTYNPNRENIGKDSLNHSEVIAIASDFLKKQLMRKILIRKYPVLLIDESQDTQKDLVKAFFAVQREYSGEFCLALFGDVMQRIYAYGMIDLDKAVPSDWEKPEIKINHRCPKRIVTLINKIRLDVDKHIQEAENGAPEGFVRLFLVPSNDHNDKRAIEKEIAEKMAEITSDERWSGINHEIKTLTLEHHMAARRNGFADFFEPLYKIDNYKTGLLDGTLSGIPLFSQQILPLVKSFKANNKFDVTRIVKKYSPLLLAEKLKESNDQRKEIDKANDAVKSLFSKWDSSSDPTLIDILKEVKSSDLFDVPDVFQPILLGNNSAIGESDLYDTTETTDKESDIGAWDKALNVPFSQLESYVEYISDKSQFGTHQGIKGLQFPRVMVILDDNEARGFMFNYVKYLGGMPQTTTDEKNKTEGKETSIDRTRRLFYVTCSRAQSSLAVVVYTDEIDKVFEHVKEREWFDDSEIIKMI